MASERSGSDDRIEEAHERRECMPCRGTGRVISNLGGTPSEVTCPWCEGGGTRLPGHDAQAHWPAEARVESSAAQAPAPEPQAAAPEPQAAAPEAQAPAPEPAGSDTAGPEAAASRRDGPAGPTAPA